MTTIVARRASPTWTEPALRDACGLAVEGLLQDWVPTGRAHDVELDLLRQVGAYNAAQLAMWGTPILRRHFDELIRMAEQLADQAPGPAFRAPSAGASTLGGEAARSLHDRISQDWAPGPETLAPVGLALVKAAMIAATRDHGVAAAAWVGAEAEAAFAQVRRVTGLGVKA